MGKLKKTLTIVTLLVFVLYLFTKTVFASDTTRNLFEKVEYSKDFKNWLELSDEEKKKVMQPRMYDIIPTNTIPNNLLYSARLLGANANSRYSLKDIIPSNLTIRNQQQTQACWAFAALSSLETNIALSNYKNGTNTSKVYDYSERHMEYANSKTFANNVENKSGYNRSVNSGGNWYIAESYLTNGLGAIDEKDMPFENNTDLIDISEIQNKTVTSQLYDTIDFADYRVQTDEKKEEIMNEIKQHIQNYGSVFASIHGNSASVSEFDCYNNETGAKFCNNTILHSADHAVSIIGWDDNYSIDNFAEGVKPTSNGAWIIRNSWGERLEYSLSEFKEEVFNTYKQQCIARGWNSASEIPNEFIEQAGFTIENDKCYIKIGDNGIMYVSYEDCNISKSMSGIIKASDVVEYENIYQYDEYCPAGIISFNGSKTMICNIFDKKTAEPEYITQVSIRSPETYRCKVYVNSNGTNKSKKDMQLVQLKAGESETFNAGYHTLEFSKPIEIKANKFAVVVEIEGTRADSVNINLEAKLDEVEILNSVQVESGKCFIATTNDFDTCQWMDLGHLSEQVPTLPNADSTIKAFVVSELNDESLKNIEIVTPPTKTKYFEGENFDKTGMVVKANYNSKKNPSKILDEGSYNITYGNNLKAGQTSVTITYDNKSVEQPITVEKNSVTDLKIKTPPTKTEYKEGQSFDKTGMVVEATFKDGTTKNITDYTIENGNNLKANQTQVKISYGEKSIQQPITVIPNPLIEIKVTKAPNKTKYVVGQDFDETGMVVTGIYQDKSTYEILDYIIENGKNLKKEQTSVTVKYEGKTVEQAIIVEEKAVTNITISKKPSKTQYIRGKEDLDLTGGSITVNYNDGSSEKIDLNSERLKISGFDNTNIGKNTITITYEGKTTSFDIEIIAESKPENSNFDNANSTVNSIKYYTFTDSIKKEYFIMDITVDKISKSTANDSYEYYYYISSNQDERNIENWVKITDYNSYEDKLEFKINTNDIKNYAELSGTNNLYLYIKEVAIKGGNQAIKISKAMELKNSNVTTEIYLNGAKVNNANSANKEYSDNNNSSDTDQTTRLSRLPNTGISSILVIILVIISGGTIFYIRYKKLSKYIK